MVLVRPEYYQGILQLRNPTEEVISYIYECVGREKKVLITKEKRVDKGVDLYFASQAYLRGLGKKLQQRFGGELKVTATLHTEKKGRKLYRVTVLFRLPRFKKGETIIFETEPHIILLLGKKALIKNVRTGQKKWLGFGELEKCRPA